MWKITEEKDKLNVDISGDELLTILPQEILEDEKYNELLKEQFSEDIIFHFLVPKESFHPFGADKPDKVISLLFP